MKKLFAALLVSLVALTCTASVFADEVSDGVSSSAATESVISDASQEQTISDASTESVLSSVTENSSETVSYIDDTENNSRTVSVIVQQDKSTEAISPIIGVVMWIICGVCLAGIAAVIIAAIIKKRNS